MPGALPAKATKMNESRSLALKLQVIRKRIETDK